MSKSRAKGTNFESEVVAYLRANGFPEAKRTGSANFDAADIEGTPFAIECKNQKAMALAAWVDQSRKSGYRIGKFPFLVHKRARKPIEQAYVTIELRDIVWLAKNFCSWPGEAIPPVPLT